MIQKFCEAFSMNFDRLIPSEFATSDFNANEPKGFRNRYYYNTPPYSCHNFADTVIGVDEALIRYPTSPKNLKVGIHGTYFAAASALFSLNYHLTWLISHGFYRRPSMSAPYSMKMRRRCDEDATKKDQERVTTEDVKTKISGTPQSRPATAN